MWPFFIKASPKGQLGTAKQVQIASCKASMVSIQCQIDSKMLASILLYLLLNIKKQEARCCVY
jgi:hypothetical protein